MISRMLNRTLEVWRPTTVPDDMGGSTETLVQLASVTAKVDRPTTEEQKVAAQWQSEHSHNVFLRPTADVRRGDELRGNGQVFRVLAVSEPSIPRYQRANCELIQSEGN